MKKVIVFVSVLVILVIALLINIDMNNEEKIIEEKRDYNIEEYETAIFAGGCFWCMEPPFEKLEGVKDAISGYTGGSLENPTYEEVSSGDTEHLEAVKVVYDSSVISYEELLDVFWRQIDPTDDGGQFVDRGYQYTSAIFYKNAEEKKLAEESLEELQNNGRFDEPIVTPIREVKPFYKAEEYHQDYYIKSDVKYKYYRSRSGRDEFLNKKWGTDE